MFGPTTRTVWIHHADGRPVRMWTIWGADTSGLNWSDSRWREFADGEYRMTLGSLPPIPFTVRKGQAFHTASGKPLQLSS